MMTKGRSGEAVACHTLQIDAAAGDLAGIGAGEDAATARP